MERIVLENGQYTVYAKNNKEAIKIIKQELKRVDKIREKVASLLSDDGIAKQNFLENASEENLNIEFNSEDSLIFNNKENANTKGEVAQRSYQNGRFTYNLAYRYPDIQGHNADFRLAHEMGHLLLNPSNSERQIFDESTNSRQISGLIRVDRSNNQIYGMKIQENAINLIAQLAVREECSADDIITGKVDVSEYNLYKKADDIVKLLAVSMRNDFEKEMSFEQLVERKIDSFIERSDGTKEPANTFFYGVLNDSSMVEKEFDKYMGKGAWRDLDTFVSTLHNPDISKEQFDIVFKEAQGMIVQFANIRYQDKYKEAIARNGSANVPTLESKLSIINEMAGIRNQRVSNETVRNNANQQQKNEMPEGYSINEFGEIIRPARENNTYQAIEKQDQIENKLTLKQRIAQFLQKNNLLKNVSFIDKFIHKQLDVLPPTAQKIEEATKKYDEERERFINELTNFGKNRNLPPIRQMSDPEKIEKMRREMESKPKQKSSDDNERY